MQSDYRLGEVFGRLTLTGHSYITEVNGYRRRLVQASCSCGSIEMYVFDSIRKGDTQSCGCLKRDLERLNPHRITHGLSKHPLYKVYNGMKERCVNPNHNRYEYYGGKGIRLCQEWLDDFKAFYDWALANGYKKGLTIHRKKSYKNYEPDNCMFVTYQRQRLDMDNIQLFTAFGESKCLTEWSKDERCKVSFTCLYQRLTVTKDDWPDIELAITTPNKIRGVNIVNRAENKMITAFGETKSISDWMKDERVLIDEKTFRKRYRHKDRESVESMFTRKMRKSTTKKDK